jgi:uncharacterized membrane protein YfcA
VNSLVLILGSAGFGLALGLFGSGGSLLALPALVYGLGFDIKQGVVGSLVVVGVTAVIGAVSGLRRGEICVKNALSFMAASLPAGFGGAVVGRLMDPHWQSLAFAGLVILAGLRLALWRVPERENTCNPRWLPLFLSGAGVGFLTGLLGVGGGFLIVPALVILGGIGVKMARGTSLLLIAANSAAAFGGYAGHVEVPWQPLLWAVAVSVPAGFGGAALARRLPTAILQRLFAWGLLALGVFLMIQGMATK